jgi:hypothetical protein
MAVINREFILAEVRRVASAMGKPPGKAQFFSHSGIKESDWSGRYWARWNDVLREAGYSPNRLQTAHSDEHLMESLAGLIRENGGKFPTRPEMRLKRRADPSFPDANTFGKFGARTDLAKRLWQHYEGRDGYDDILAACAVPLSSVALRSADTNVASDGSDFGFVYLIKSGRHYKIGRSNAVGRRERELAIQLPEKSSTVHVIRTDDPPGIERYWHQRFESRRRNGEWFELTSADVAAFRRRKFM